MVHLDFFFVCLFTNCQLLGDPYLASVRHCHLQSWRQSLSKPSGLPEVCILFMTVLQSAFPWALNDHLFQNIASNLPHHFSLL